MESNFMDLISGEAVNDLQYQRTEKGAVGYKSTGNILLDMEFKIPSYRYDTSALLHDFYKAYESDRVLSLRWMFHLRDITQGVGERSSFRYLLVWLSDHHPLDAIKVVDLVAEYGRWDDLFYIFNRDELDDVSCHVLDLIKDQIYRDLEIAVKKDGSSISLLAKWMPSADASSAGTRRLASIIRKWMKMSKMDYKCLLKYLREYLDIVEGKMSRNEWDKIVYEHVPSKANLIYKRAFMEHDTDRRKEYLKKLAEGKTEINAKALFPYEIVSKYDTQSYYSLNLDETLEALWKALPTPVEDLGGTLVVRDGSGSMNCETFLGSTARAIDIATSLAIYASERAKGPYKDKFITFSRRPKMIDLSNCETLAKKIQVCKEQREVDTTNIEAVFDLVLNTAVKHHCSQEDLPSSILIVSDMEFDDAAESNLCDMDPLMDTVYNRFASYGYELPKLVFWNVSSRTNTIPMLENKNGLVLVSGFSVNTFKMVVSNNLDPVQVLIDELMGERYDAVANALAE